MKFFTAICLVAAFATHNVAAQDNSSMTFPPSAQNAVGNIVNEITEVFGSASFEGSESGSGNGTTNVGDDTTWDSEDSEASIQMISFATSTIVAIVAAAVF